jgi:ribulose-5-phosphate 4-epimerase/fuculose-1-phosphate aldolase
MPALATGDVDADLLAGCAVLEREGLTTAFGHLSARVGSDAVRISGSAGPGLMRSSADLLTIALDGTVLAGHPGARPGEVAIHLGVLAARDDVAAVSRFHGPACLAFSTLGGPLPAVIGMAMFAGGEVPWFDTQITITTPEQGAALAAKLDRSPAILIRGFGAVTVGSSVADAVVRAWLLERSARAALDAMAAGTPLSYPVAAAAAFDPDLGAPARGQLDRAWRYLNARAFR